MYQEVAQRLLFPMQVNQHNLSSLKKMEITGILCHYLQLWLLVQMGTGQALQGYLTLTIMEQNLQDLLYGQVICQFMQKMLVRGLMVLTSICCMSPLTQWASPIIVVMLTGYLTAIIQI